MIDSVVGLVEEHVGSGGSRFSESILERWYFACVSQRNVVVLEFLKSMSSSILSRVNSLSVLSVVISRCTSGTARSAISCLSGALIDREFAQLGFLQTDLSELQSRLA